MRPHGVEKFFSIVSTIDGMSMYVWLAQHPHQNNGVHTEFADWNVNTNTIIACGKVSHVLWNSCTARDEFEAKNNISVFNESDMKQWKTV